MPSSADYPDREEVVITYAYGTPPIGGEDSTEEPMPLDGLIDVIAGTRDLIWLLSGAPDWDYVAGEREPQGLLAVTPEPIVGRVSFESPLLLALLLAHPAAVASTVTTVGIALTQLVQKVVDIRAQISRGRAERAVDELHEASANLLTEYVSGSNLDTSDPAVQRRLQAATWAISTMVDAETSGSRVPAGATADA